jgi:CRP-like cAMP-binding protein
MQNQNAPDALQLNLLLKRASRETLERLEKVAAIEEVKLGQRMAEFDETNDILFPLDAVISVIRPLEDGNQFEVGIIGCDGATGINAILGVATAGYELLAQSEGRVARLPATTFLFEFAKDVPFRDILLKYVYAFMAQTSQHSACNHFHHIGRRLARWLLMLHDRLPGDELKLTQQFLALMLGTRRSGVTVAVNELRLAGAITHARSLIVIRDRERLESLSCECYAAVVEEYKRALGFSPYSGASVTASNGKVSQ